MTNGDYAKFVGRAFKESKNMAPVGKGTNALVAFLAGFLLGPLGVGVYLKSWGDFVMATALVVLGSMMTAGVGAPVFWMLCGAWGAVRVSNSNG